MYFITVINLKLINKIYYYYYYFIIITIIVAVVVVFVVIYYIAIISVSLWHMTAASLECVHQFSDNPEWEQLFSVGVA